MGEWWPIVIALPFVAMLLLSGVWASQRFAGYARLPSHFNIRGQADRFASRNVMVWMLPILFSFMLLAIGVASVLVPAEYRNGDPITGQLISGVALVSAQALVLWLTDRWARAQ